MGASAGAWVATKATKKADFDFMITQVGPSTSVEVQQMQSMREGAKVFGLSEKATEDAIKYTQMMFKAPADQRSLAEFNRLLAVAEKDGWKDLLEDTDIPTDVIGIKNLWVRRHNYDPKTQLAQFQKPMLAIYGEKDWIVPYEWNIKLLEFSFMGIRHLLTTVVVPDGGHGLETEAKHIDLGGNQEYWRFYRNSPSNTIAVIDFLAKHGFIEVED